MLLKKILLKIIVELTIILYTHDVFCLSACCSGKHNGNKDYAIESQSAYFHLRVGEKVK